MQLLTRAVETQPDLHASAVSLSPMSRSHTGDSTNSRASPLKITPGTAPAPNRNFQSASSGNTTRPMYASRMPIVIISWKMQISEPRRAMGAISAIYNGAATEMAPTPIPTISSPIRSTSSDGAIALTNAPKVKGRGRHYDVLLPDQVGDATGGQRADDRADQRGRTQPGGLATIQRAGRYAGLVAEDQPAQRRDADHEVTHCHYSGTAWSLPGTITHIGDRTGAIVGTPRGTGNVLAEGLCAA